jgi:hypothetical protein
MYSVAAIPIIKRMLIDSTHAIPIDASYLRNTIFLLEYFKVLWLLRPLMMYQWLSKHLLSKLA